MQDCHISPMTANVHLLVCVLAHALASLNQLHKLRHVPCVRVPPSEHYQRENGSSEPRPPKCIGLTLLLDRAVLVMLFTDVLECFFFLADYLYNSSDIF